MAERSPFSEALHYHEFPIPGKVAIRATKPTATQTDLSLAYTPGVAEPCREIARDPEAAFRFTNRGNLVAVVSNGTAVLGLGNIGPLAGKPVMEGKAVLFKRFADIDVFDLEIDAPDPDDVIRFCELLGTNGWWNQPRGHPGSGLLLHRRRTSQAALDSGLPRRPARDGDHRRRGISERL